MVVASTELELKIPQEQLLVQAEFEENIRDIFNPLLPLEIRIGKLEEFLLKPAQLASNFSISKAFEWKSYLTEWEKFAFFKILNKFVEIGYKLQQPDFKFIDFNVPTVLEDNFSEQNISSLKLFLKISQKINVSPLRNLANMYSEEEAMAFFGSEKFTGDDKELLEYVNSDFKKQYHHLQGCIILANKFEPKKTDRINFRGYEVEIFKSQNRLIRSLLVKTAVKLYDNREKLENYLSENKKNEYFTLLSSALDSFREVYHQGILPHRKDHQQRFLTMIQAGKVLPLLVKMGTESINGIATNNHSVSLVLSEDYIVYFNSGWSTWSRAGLFLFKLKAGATLDSFLSDSFNHRLIGDLENTLSDIGREIFHHGISPQEAGSCGWRGGFYNLYSTFFVILLNQVKDPKLAQNLTKSCFDFLYKIDKVKTLHDYIKTTLPEEQQNAAPLLTFCYSQMRDSKVSFLAAPLTEIEDVLKNNHIPTSAKSPCCVLL